MKDEILARDRSIAVKVLHAIDPGQLRIINYNDRFGDNCVLTFDDGPNQNTTKVLDALKINNIRGAIFCVKGINVKQHPQILRRIVDDGHVLANHSWDHPDLCKLAPNLVERQLEMCQNAVNDALGRQYVLKQMRPPYGAINDQVKGILRSRNFEVLLW